MIHWNLIQCNLARLNMIGKRFFISGINGMLGSSFKNYFLKNNIDFIDKYVDILNEKGLSELMKKYKPTHILHLAALTNVDYCELNPKESYSINYLGTKNILNYKPKGSKIIYLSSTGVYGDMSILPHKEDEIPYPKTIHHTHKLMSEKILSENDLIIRTGWLYGGDINQKKNFVAKIIKESHISNFIYSDKEKYGNPTYVEDLIFQTIVLIQNEFKGLFNCVNNGSNISRFDYVKKIVELTTLKPVKEAPLNYHRRYSPIPNNEMAFNERLDNLGLNKMREWDKALIEYINKIKVK